MVKAQLDLTKHKIWKDKNVKPESKEIFAYIYAKIFGKIITHINVGEIQQVVPITNIGLRNNLKILEKYKYLIFKEYDKGLYEIHVC